MKTKKHDTRWMVSVALMAAIIIVLANTPLGMIQLPVIKATTVHIPVIIGAILLGPGAGAILGAVFGICSLISNTMAPTLLSFAFSPFMSTTGIVGAIKAIWISVGCRVLIGVAAGWLWILLNKLKVNQTIALPIVGFAGSMVNTITVMGSIYLLFAQQYAEAKEVAITAVWGLVMGTVTASGIPEAIAAAILVLAVGKSLIVVLKRMGIISYTTNKTNNKEKSTILIPVISVIILMVGIILCVESKSMGTYLYDHFNVATEHLEGYEGYHIDYHECAAYGKSMYYVSILGFKLWHEESCQNFFFVVGGIFVLVGIINCIKSINKYFQHTN